MARLRKSARKAASKKWVRAPRKRTVLVNRALAPIAQRYITKMKYAESVNVVIPAGGRIGFWKWNLNSINKPNADAVGHQPYGHDQFSALYNRYRVIACSYKITTFNTTNPTIEPLQLTAVPANTAVAPGGAAPNGALRENPRARYIAQGPGAPLKVLSGKVYLPSLVGRSKAQYMADDRYQAQFGADPAEICYLNVGAGVLSDGAVGVQRDVTVQIELVYHVEMFDINPLAQS